MNFGVENWPIYFDIFVILKLNSNMQEKQKEYILTSTDKLDAFIENMLLDA